MKKLQRKFIITAAVCTALAAGIAYLIGGRWQSAAVAAGIAVIVFLLIARAVSSLVKKGVDFAVDKAGSLLRAFLAARAAAKKSSPEEPLQTPPGEEQETAGEGEKDQPETEE